MKHVSVRSSIVHWLIYEAALGIVSQLVNWNIRQQSVRSRQVYLMGVCPCVK